MLIDSALAEVHSCLGGSLCSCPLEAAGERPRKQTRFLLPWHTVPVVLTARRSQRSCPIRKLKITMLTSISSTLLLLLLFVCLAASFAINTPAQPAIGGNVPPVANRNLEIGESIEETGFYQSIRLKSDASSILAHRQSNFQLIQVVETVHYGRALLLDGVMQVTERDGDAYNEMMAHIPLFQHAKPKRVLLIGGGDGYVLAEILKHPSVTHVDHVDLDKDVIDACREYFQWGKEAWDDPRVTLHIADGAKFVKDTVPGTYDVIIQDSSDPWTWDEDGSIVELPAGVLYSAEHFKNMQRALAPEGILNIQAETLQIPSDVDGIVAWRELMFQAGYKGVRYGSIMISSYPTGQIGFLLAEKAPKASSQPMAIKERYLQMATTPKGKTTYYHPRLQASAFDLPLWAEERIYGDDEVRSVCEAPDGGAPANLLSSTKAATAIQQNQ